MTKYERFFHDSDNYYAISKQFLNERHAIRHKVQRWNRKPNFKVRIWMQLHLNRWFTYRNSQCRLKPEFRVRYNRPKPTFLMRSKT